MASALVGNPVYSAEGTSGKTIQAVRTDTPPKIDGVLDDAVWQKAAVVEDLHEVTPNEFSETSEPYFKSTYSDIAFKVSYTFRY